MSSSLILKLSIVSNGGISITEQPPSSAVAKEQLAAGLMAAMLAFSKEVHNQELESLSLHDRSISFIMVGEFFIVAEIASTAGEELLGIMIAEIKKRAEIQLKGYTYTTLVKEIADRILIEFLSKDWLNETLDDFGYNKPFKSSPIHTFNLKKENNVYNIHAEDELVCYKQIADFIIKGVNEVEVETRDFITAFIPTEEPEPMSHYIVARIKPDDIEVALLHVEDELSSTLFKLSPFIDQEIKRYLTRKPDGNLIGVLETLKDTHDIILTENLHQNDNISLTFLEKNMKKKLDQVLYSVVRGDRIIIMGDRPTVRIFIHSLLLFSQHRAIELVDWLLEDDIIGTNLTGMSKSKFNEIVGKIEGEYIVVDLDKSKVEGGKSNKYLKNLFSQVKKKSIKEASELLNDELTKLVSDALKITYFVLLEKDVAVKKLEEIKNEIKDEDKFNLIMDLAKQRNPWLVSMIQEIKSALKGAEDYLSHF